MSDLMPTESESGTLSLASPSLAPSLAMSAQPWPGSQADQPQSALRIRAAQQCNAWCDSELKLPVTSSRVCPWSQCIERDALKDVSITLSSLEMAHENLCCDDRTTGFFKVRH